MSYPELAESLARLREDHDSLEKRVDDMVSRFDKQDVVLERIALAVGEPPNKLAKDEQGIKGWGLARVVVEGTERRRFILWLIAGIGTFGSIALSVMAIIKILEFVLTHQAK